MIKFIFCIGILATALVAAPFSNSLAHEGHDNTPGMLKANHGGVVKSGQIINLEYTVNGNVVTLYPATHDGKDLPSNEVTLTATTMLPKSKNEAAKIENKNGVYSATVDFKNAYRIEMNVTAIHQNKKSTFKFQIEK